MENRIEGPQSKFLSFLFEKSNFLDINLTINFDRVHFSFIPILVSAVGGAFLVGRMKEFFYICVLYSV